MYIHSLFRPIDRFVERIRLPFFSPQEWWFQVVLFMAIFPVGCYINVGPRYLTDGVVFGLGTLWGLAVYCLNMWGMTLIIRRLIARYNRFNQTLTRTLLMILVLNTWALGNTFTQYYLLCRIPLFGNRFDWEALSQLFTISLTGMTTLCILASLLYANQQWKREQDEVEGLKSQTIQQQLDALRQQVNPHFLFNSLSSISSLVGEDPQQAEWFVDGLAKVYRYMLRSNDRRLVPLGEELTFTRTYAQLLEVRYGHSLRVELPEPEAAPAPLALPPLTLQMLIDNAINHNRMSPQRPLVIRIERLNDQWLQVSNRLQPKLRLLEPAHQGLSQLVARYQVLSQEAVQVQQEPDYFRVTLPLLGSTEA